MRRNREQQHRSAAHTFICENVYAARKLQTNTAKRTNERMNDTKMR